MMTGPFLALFAVFFVGPFVYSIILSLRSPLTGAYSGLLNYRTVMSNGTFWSGVVRMGYFGAVQVTVMIGLAIGLALLLDSPYCRGKKVFALIYFLPYAVPGVIAAIMWGFLLEPDLDGALGVPHQIGLASGPIQPLDYRLALYAIMLIVTWEWTGYNMTILLTSLTNVPHQVLEAAKVDGASELSIAARIKLPMVRRTVLFTIMLSIIGTLQLFNEPVILNEIATTGSALTPNQIIYTTAFSFGNEELAAAQSVVLAGVTIVATVAFFGIVRSRTGPAARAGAAAK
jgi:multiple sugar transport system permease protein